MTLLYLLIAAVLTGLAIGLLAKMPPRQLAAMCALLAVTAWGFYALVGLL